MKRILLLSLVFIVSLTGCEQKKDMSVAAKVEKGPAVALQLPIPKLIFDEPTEAHRFELPSEALQIWRHSKSVKPALVLFSIHPLLVPVAEERKQDISELIRSGDADTFKNRGSFFRVNPALAPTQTVTAAIDNDLFSEVIWVIPTQSKVEELSLDVFRKQVVDAGFLTEQEGSTLSYSEGVTSGTVRGLPFRAVHPDVLPDLDKPVVIHFDTGYFKGMFKNEVATPLFDILHQTVSRVMQSEWQVYSTTLSYSTQELMFSLDVRFLITNLAKIIENPELLQQMPPAWKLHGDSMYIGKMYMETKAQEIIEEALVAAPDDPTIVYTLSQIRFQQGRAEEAFTLLDRAVQLDPGYATAYMQLSDTGIENGQFDKSLVLQRKAISQYPENPFLKINEAGILIAMGNTDEAITKIETLQKLPWSPAFHPNIFADLNAMAEYARNPQPIDTAAPATPQQEKK